MKKIIAGLVIAAVMLPVGHALASVPQGLKVSPVYEDGWDTWYIKVTNQSEWKIFNVSCHTASGNNLFPDKHVLFPGDRRTFQVRQETSKKPDQPTCKIIRTRRMLWLTRWVKKANGAFYIIVKNDRNYMMKVNCWWNVLDGNTLREKGYIKANDKAYAFSAWKPSNIHCYGWEA